MKDDERMVLEAVEEALSAQGAWCGHCYGFQYMEEYYEPLLAIAKKLDISTEWLEKVYQDVVSEYQDVADSESKSFLNEEDDNRIILQDIFFIEALAEVCKKISVKPVA